MVLFLAEELALTPHYLMNKCKGYCIDNKCVSTACELITHHSRYCPLNRQCHAVEGVARGVWKAASANQQTPDRTPGLDVSAGTTRTVPSAAAFACSCEEKATRGKKAKAHHVFDGPHNQACFWVWEQDMCFRFPLPCAQTHPSLNESTHLLFLEPCKWGGDSRGWVLCYGSP